MSELEQCYKCGKSVYGKAMMSHLDVCGLIAPELDRASRAVDNLPQWMKDLEQQRYQAWRKENMCDFCPDDEFNIDTHRDRIKYWEEKISLRLAGAELAKAELASARKTLRSLLRSGKIRNR